MKALLLVGGYGTRLRPLTLTIPKPLVHFCNRSILEHQVEALIKVGVDHIILAVSYKPETMTQALNELKSQYRIRIDCSIETKSLGTAGPIRLAESLLTDDGQIQDPRTPFFVLNSDIICEFPLHDMLAFHRQHKGEGTILVTKVSDPARFGVVLFEPVNGQISQFVEKPKEYVGDYINAGVYLLNVSAIQRITLSPTSIETEIFPIMALEHALYCFPSAGYWMDVGQPKDYMSGMKLYLKKLRQEKDLLLATGDNIIGNVLIHPTAQVDPEAFCGPDVTVGPRCIIRAGARLQQSAIMEDVIIESHAYLSNALVGNQCHIHSWSRVEGLSVLGENVTVNKEVFVHEICVLPHKTLKESVFEKGKIIL